MTRTMVCLLFCCLFAASGCASIELPAAGPRHPANPEAQSAALSRPTGTLDIDKDNLPVPPSQMQPKTRMHRGENSHEHGSVVDKGGEP